MPVGTSLGIDLSTTLVEGSTDPWGTALNTVLQTIINSVEAKVPTSGIEINADLEYNGYRLTEVKSTQMDAQGSSLTGASNARSTWVDTAGNLYFTNGSGTAVQVTSGSTVNVGSVGSIVDTSGGGGLGAYGSGGRQLEWDGTYFLFKDGTGGAAFGQVKLDNLLVADEASVRFVTISSPAIGSNYTITLPTAVPGSTSLLLMDSGGAMSTSRTPSIDTLTTSSTITANGAIAANSTLTATGLITANAGVTAGANQHVTVSGTGRFKHGNMVKDLSLAYTTTNSVVATSGGTLGGGPTFGTTSDNSSTYFFIDLPVGARIVDMEIYLSSSAVGTSGTIAWTLRQHEHTPTDTQIQALWTTSGGGDQSSGTVSVNHTLLVGTYQVRAVVSGGWDRALTVRYITMTYSFP